MYPEHLNRSNNKIRIIRRIGVIGIDDAVIAAVGIALRYFIKWLSSLFGDTKQFTAWKDFLSGKNVLTGDLLFDYGLFRDLVEYMQDNGVYSNEARKGLSFLFYNIQYAFINFPSATTSDFQNRYGISFYNYITTGIVPSKDIETTSYILLRPIYFPGIGYEQPGVPYVHPKMRPMFPDLYQYKAITDFRYPDAVWYSRTAYNEEKKVWEPIGAQFLTEIAAANDIAQQIYDFRMKNDPEFAKAQANKPPVVYSERNPYVSTLLLSDRPGQTIDLSVDNRPGTISLPVTNRPGAIKAMTQNGAIELLNNTPQALPQNVKQGQVKNSNPAQIPSNSESKPSDSAQKSSNPLAWVLGLSMLGFLITKAD